MIQNLIWLGDYNVATQYKTRDNHIYVWKTKKNINLLNIDEHNLEFIINIFTKTTKKLIPTIEISKIISYDHPYLNMSDNEKCLYEFKFCFGYISCNEQYEFMKLIHYLISNKLIDIKKRDNTSIIDKINLKMNYYKLFSLFIKKNKID